MISDLLQNIMLFLATCFNMVLSPIDTFLATYLPGVNDALLYVTLFFGKLGEVSTWILSFFGLNSTILGIIIAGVIAPPTISLVAFPVKLGIKWFNNLKIG